MVALIVIAAVLVASAAVCLWGAWENGAVQLHRLRIGSERLPKAFEGYTVVHISDLHNTPFGEAQSRLGDLMREAQPDIIVVTGDVIDKRRPGTEHALDFFARAVQLAPVYYVTGNHEAVSKEYPVLRTALEGMGVHILSDRALLLEREGESILLAGVDDPMFRAEDAGDNARVMQQKMQDVVKNREHFTVLLTHRPELIGVYCEAGVDLVLAGHAHGGQFRFPWGGGVIAPNQGLFPKYTQGVYRKDNTAMVVSRGLGNSSVPIRLNNRPEVVAITLSCTETSSA